MLINELANLIIQQLKNTLQSLLKGTYKLLNFKPRDERCFEILLNRKITNKLEII
ncbi:MAG: hypothetical protein CM15mP65_08090 [Crocinitomicaceae bacterium]|nr:MAG: hypothetical protein CM15mP65_08090 [Crocinitomicaceae bacterium]